MAKLHTEVLPALNDNYIFLITCQNSGKRAVIDPGASKPVLDYLAQKQQQLDYILCTHHHADHIDGNAEVQKTTGCKIVGGEKDKDNIPGLAQTLREGDTFVLGEAEGKVIETPGHTKGHISFYFGESNALFCGDTLFSVGCGRLFGGTPEQMYQSLSKIRELPDETNVYCGHEYTLNNIRFALSVDPDNQDLKAYQQQASQLRAEGKFTIPSRLSLEKKVNPFLRWDNPQIRENLSLQNASHEKVFSTLRAKKDRF